MAYGDFSQVKMVEAAFGLRSEMAPLFSGTPPADAPGWLGDQLARGLRYPQVSEKGRGELIVMPVLLAAVELVRGPVMIYSGMRLDADPNRGLVGECDFMLGRSDPFPEVRAPLLTMVEAKKADIDAGLGQCAAQMVGARVFNDREGRAVPTVFGCVTNGDKWQFLRLAGSTITVDSRRHYLNDLGRILATFRDILTAPVPAPGAAA